MIFTRRLMMGRKETIDVIKFKKFFIIIRDMPNIFGSRNKLGIKKLMRKGTHTQLLLPLKD